MNGTWNTWRRLTLVSLCLIAACLPVSPIAAQESTNGVEYVVQEGDTFSSISLDLGVPVADLQAANPDVAPEALGIGQLLRIPGLPGLSGRLTGHRLELGETFTSLALRFGMRADTFLRLNRVVNPERLYVTQSVLVAEQPDGSALPNGRWVETDGRSPLSLAAQLGQRPWALAGRNRLAHPGWITPGQLVAIPDETRPLRGWPAPITDVTFASPLPAAQGTTISLKVTVTRPVTISGSLSTQRIAFGSTLDDPLHVYGLGGVYRLEDPGLFPLTLWVTDTVSGQAVRFQQSVPLVEGRYVIDPPLTVDPASLDPANTRPEWDLLVSTTLPVTPAKLWDGPFSLPSAGVIRSPYGALRAYNGGDYDSYHGGVDFSGGPDRPITAPAPGIVVLTQEGLPIRGNVTILDHGWGVYTLYGHQSSFMVEAGQRVETGQVIGFQGATGRVTGPHLHWEVWVAGTQVDPLRWTEQAFP